MPSARDYLFHIPLPSTSGSITCTSPAPNIYLLSFSSPPDNRLTTEFCRGLVLALDIIEFSPATYPPGVIITTSSIPKFYSNGLDLAHASSTPGFWSQSLYQMWRRLLTYPMPTIALINGHAFAGGLMTAMFHDYRVFNPLKGFLCLNELDFGVGLKPPMSSIFRQKLPSPLTYRSLVLEAKRFTAKEALVEGIVDSLGALAEVLALIEERGLVKRAIEAYRTMKLEMWKETISYLDSHENDETREQLRGLAIAKSAQDGEKQVKEWEAALKPKL